MPVFSYLEYMRSGRRAYPDALASIRPEYPSAHDAVRRDADCEVAEALRAWDAQGVVCGGLRDERDQVERLLEQAERDAKSDDATRAAVGAAQAEICRRKLRDLRSRIEAAYDLLEARRLDAERLYARHLAIVHALERGITPGSEGRALLDREVPALVAESIRLVGGRTAWDDDYEAEERWLAANPHDRPDPRFAPSVNAELRRRREQRRAARRAGVAV